MITAGIDIGSVSTEVVLAGEENEILSYVVLPSQIDMEKTANEALDAALEKASLARQNIDYTRSQPAMAAIMFRSRTSRSLRSHAMPRAHIIYSPIRGRLLILADRIPKLSQL